MSERRRFLGFLRPTVEADIDDELRFHIDASALDLEAMGLPPAEARAEALRRFGDVASVESWLRSHDHHRIRREAWVIGMDTLLKDIRLGIRKLWQQPGFALSVVLVLALGIGAATAMFSAVDAALLRPLPFQRDERLVVVEEVNLPFERSRGSRSVMIGDARALPVFDGVAAYAPGGLNLGAGGAPLRINVGVVTPDLFAVLGVEPAAGRSFTDEEGTRAGTAVAIISDGVWRSHYGASRTAIGEKITLNGKDHEIVGIMPAGFAFPRESAVWIPLRLPYGFAEFEPFRQFMPSTNVARLASSVTIEQAREQVLALVRAAADPGQPFTLSGEDVVKPMRDVLVASRRTGLLVLMGATALVLLVACANATNLLLSRAATRRSEMALRAALGASRGRILRQLVVESLLLAIAGGIVGIAFAWIAVGALGALMPPSLAGLSAATVDLRVLGFCLLASVTTGLIFGLWPAVGATRTDAAEIIRSGGANSVAREGARLRRVFVVAELAISLVLAVGAGLMLRSLQTILGNDPGIVPDNVATLELSINRETYRQPGSRMVFLEAVLDRLRRIPGVEAAAFVNELPLRGASSVRLIVQRDGVPLSDDMDENAWGLIQHVSPEYFRAIGIPVLSGRLPNPSLDSLTREEVALSRSLAERLFPGESPLERRVTIAGDMHRTVVGVVGDIRARALDDSVGMQMYLPLAESPGPNLALVARGSMPTHVLAGHLSDAVIAEDPQQAVYNVRPMREVIATALTPRRVSTILITGFSVVALAMAAVGVYGVIAFAVTRRTREIGIRIALGARRGDVLRLVMREGLMLGVLGVVIGLAGAWILRRVVESMLYGIAPNDPIAFVTAALVLFVMAILAAYIPSGRATRVDPVKAIRAE